MRAINIYTLCYLLLRLYRLPAAAAALLPSTVLGIQSNQSLVLDTPTLTSVLSAPPSPPEPPAPPAPTETQSIACFNRQQRHVRPLTLRDCYSTIELILHTAPGPMIPQNFSSRGAEGTHKVPVSWEVGNCHILIATKDVDDDTWDEFRYVDIVDAAQDVLATCVPRSRMALGGIKIMGEKGFYIAVNGTPRLVVGNVTEDGDEMYATPIGTSTAVGIALPTGTSALVSRDELDEELALSLI